MYCASCTVYIQTKQSTSARVGLDNKKYIIGVVIFNSYFKIYVILIKNSSKQHWVHTQTMRSDDYFTDSDPQKFTCLQFHRGGRRANVSRDTVYAVQFP